jgi:hypothetical protein
LETDGNVINTEGYQKPESEKPLFFALDNETPGIHVEK